MSLQAQVEAELKKALKENNMESWIKADLEFHKNLLEMANNRYIKEAMKRINDQVHRVRRIYVQVKGKPAQSTKDHEKMMQAIRTHNGKLAREVTEQHLKRVREDHIRIFSGLGRI